MMTIPERATRERALDGRRLLVCGKGGSVSIWTSERQSLLRFSAGGYCV